MEIIDDEIQVVDEKDKLRSEVLAEADAYLIEVLERVRSKEIEKTEEELAFLQKINLWLGSYLQKHVGEGYFHEIMPEQVIVLGREDFLTTGRDINGADWSGYDGKMVIFGDKIFIFLNKHSEMKGYAKLSTLLHEVVHSLSANSMNITVKRDGDDKYRSTGGTARSGLSITSAKSNEEDAIVLKYFEGLNEAITQMVTIDILSRHEGELTGELGLRPEEINSLQDYYQGYQLVFAQMVRSMAEKLGGSPADYWFKFRTGFFRGDMMFMRDVEKVFGLGSLRVLAYLGADPNHYKNIELLKLFFEYFKESDLLVRKRIAETIFDREEDERYFIKYKERFGVKKDVS